MFFNVSRKKHGKDWVATRLLATGKFFSVEQINFDLKSLCILSYS